MAETPNPERPREARSSDFRWQSLFQQATDALFVLNHQRRILFVNRAWEKLTGLPADEARGLVCTRRKTARALARALCPPPEVLHGSVGRVRRLMPSTEAARRWWDIDFFPLREADSVLVVLGRVSLVVGDTATPTPPLPAELAAVLEALARKHNPDQLDGRVPAVRRVIEQVDSIVAVRGRYCRRFELHSLSSETPAMKQAVDQVRLAGPASVGVLIRGEPGVGKHWLARTIHSLEPAREQTFVRLDCARLPPAALAATLFDDGGLLQRPGIGTLYLRQPGSLPRDLQARLVELLDDPTRHHPRVIAGLSKHSGAPVPAADLLDELHRALATITIRLPPLRERTADLPRLVERLLERAKGEAAHPVIGFTEDAWEFLKSYRWPGNLRELYAVIQGACARAKGERIDTSDLPAYLRRNVVLEQTPGRSPERLLALDQILEQVERRLMPHALRMADGNKTKAAELLSIWRPRLIRRMEALGITDSEPKEE